MKLNTIFLLLFSLLIPLSAFSQKPTKDFISISKKIDEEQKRIDLLDRVEDTFITLSNKKAEEKANEAYFALIDMMQISIINSKQSGDSKYQDLNSLLNILLRINEKNYFYAAYFHGIIENAYGIINSKMANQLELYIYKNTKASIQNILLFKDDPIALQILLEASKSYPGEVLKIIPQISNEVYATELVDYICAIAPNNIKQYFSSPNVINHLLVVESKSEIVKTVLAIYLDFGPNSNAYLFLDKIMENPTPATIAKYHNLGKEKDAVFKELIELRKKKSPLSEFNIEQELKVASLEFIRPINDMHLLKDARERFASVEELTPEELYTIMVYTPEEIFTSTFNGIFERMIKKLNTEKIDRLEFLQSLGYNKFRTFIKLCSGYNTLNTYINPLEASAVDSLFSLFVSNLQLFETDLSEAVNVADTFGSIEDDSLISIIAKHIHEQHQMMLETNQIRGEIIYGLLLSLISTKVELANLEGFNEENLFLLEGINSIPSNQLFNQNGENIQQHFFYDDDDGIYSYGSFIQAFSGSNWKIVDSNEYVIVKSNKGMPVSVFANKPTFEREGQERIKRHFEAHEIYPDIVVHRGHSYYANISIEGVSPYTSVVFLGSCGSYHNLTGVVDRSEIAHIISSKQIGTAVINNAVLRHLCDEIREGNDIVWEDIWKRLDNEFKGSKYDRDKFADYIPPHKNMGALFIKTFRELTY